MVYVCASTCLIMLFWLGVWIWKELASQRLERTSVASGAPDSTQQQAEQAGTRVQLNRTQSAFGIPTAGSLGPLQPPVSLEFCFCFITLFKIFSYVSKFI